MPEFIFSGHSDDCIEIEGAVVDELCHYDGLWQANLIAPDRTGLTVTGWFDQNGTWHFGVGQIDEGYEFPAWPIRFGQCPDATYSVQVTIDAPDGAFLDVIGDTE